MQFYSLFIREDPTIVARPALSTPDSRRERIPGGGPRFDEPRRLDENKKVGHCGPVAQLGARFHGMEEVIGSIPIRSTNQSHTVL